jgi:hypothetical protein
MVSISKNGKSINFVVLGYQYPDIIEGIYDPNWLNIRIKVHDELYSWEKTDPALTSWELKEISEWFSSLAIGETPNDKLIHFIEPCIAFQYEYRNNMREITFLFAAEMFPPDIDRANPYSVSFQLSKEELADLANQFTKEASLFSVRGDVLE